MEPRPSDLRTEAVSARRTRSIKLKSIRTAVQKRRVQFKAEGRCRECGNQVVPGLAVCAKHWMFGLARNNLGTSLIEMSAALFNKLVKQQWSCPYTGRELVPGSNIALDHILPVSRFPEQSTDLSNVEFVSEDINKAKGDLTKEEFIDLCRAVVAYVDNPTATYDGPKLTDADTSGWRKRQRIVRSSHA